MKLLENASDEELYLWFVANLAENGSANEVRPDVIEVVADNICASGCVERVVD